MTTTNQLELGFRTNDTANRSRVSPPPRGLRATRARWWFAKMREAVATATTWQEPSRPN